MPTLKFSLFKRIILWFFLNLLLVGAILFVFFNFNFRFRPGSDFSGGFGNNIEFVTRQISNESDEKTRGERDEILKRYAEKYKGVEFFLFDSQGNQLGGREINLPPTVLEEIVRENALPPMPAGDGNSLPAPREPRRTGEQMPPRGLPPPMMPPSIYTRTSDPTLYWFDARIGLFDKDKSEITRARLIAVSDSFYGYGLFYNPTPWLILTGIIVAVSILFWFPFVRSITKAVGQITTATEQIAEERFDTRVSEKRTDEIGRLGTAINHLAARLAGFVGGQKRFLGDISHELNSPLARMNFALQILEDRVDEANRAYVEDVKEEVLLMSKLVSELLAYSKAGIKTTEITLEKVRLRPLVESIVERERATKNADVKISIDENVEALAQPELLMRAVGNVVRNAIRYAGDAGEICVSATNGNDQTRIEISDNGAGVPEDSLEKLFDPFYRVEADRARQTGGTGLGLAIVKTCVEACEGKVSAKNRIPKGLAVTICLKN